MKLIPRRSIFESLGWRNLVSLFDDKSYIAIDYGTDSFAYSLYCFENNKEKKMKVKYKEGN